MDELVADCDELIELWKKMRALGTWVLDVVEIEGTKAEIEEMMDLLYLLEVENAKLKEQYLDPQTGRYKRRLIWDLR